jgi:myo-inositol 2-dehydrogenase / D-chiro-inositol 1-dehydrogenase
MQDGSGLHLGLVGVGRIGTMHARNLMTLPDLARLTLADADRAQAARVAAEVDAHVADSVEALLGAGLDGLVVASGTASHPALVTAAVDAGLPVLCEKPIAPDVPSSLPVLAHVAEMGGVVMIGHQRRLDRGYLEARRALAAGELGWLHSARAVTCDAAPPPVGFLASSGGLFRDVSVHDFDVLQWVTGRQVTQVYALGSNNGDPAIADAGDIDTGLAVCTLDDGTVATVTASRYNGAGHDVRLELQGSAGTVVVGLDEASPLRSAEPGTTFPEGPAHRTFAQRFSEAYRAEMQAFAALVRGESRNPCPPEEAVSAARVADAAQTSLQTGGPVRVKR